MKYFKKIVGPRLYLSPINIEDAPIYTKWLNDPKIAAHLGVFSKTISLSAEKKGLEQRAEEGHNYSIVLKDGDQLLGNISLMEVDYLNRRATLGIFIGEWENHGKGYGLEAIQLLLEYGFSVLNLRNVMLLVHSDNHAAISCYKKAGFSEIGRRRASHSQNGGSVDVVYMDILDSDFYADKKETVL